MQTDLSKKQRVDADSKAIQQINFTGNLACDPITNTAMCFITEEAKHNFLDHSHGTLNISI